MKKTIVLFFLCFIQIAFSALKDTPKWLKKLEEPSMHRQLRDVSSCKNSSIAEMHCQVYDQEVRVHASDAVLFDIKVLHKQPRIVRHGFVCTGVTYHHSCSENFFGVEEVKRWKTATEISDAECKVAVDKHLSGTKVSLEYPQKECYWNQYKEKRSRQITVTPHQFHFDPVTERIDDPLISGHCGKEATCMTTKSHQKVFFSEGLNYHPSEYYMLDLGFEDIPMRTIHSSIIGTLRIADLKSFQLFGLTWWTDGKSLAFSTDYKFTDSKVSKDATYDLSEMSNDDWMRVISAKSRAYMESFTCTQLLPVIKDTGKLYANQLMLLRPHVEGAVTVYVIHGEDHKISSCKGWYSYTDSVERDLVNDVSTKVLVKHFGEEFYTSFGYWKNSSWHRYNNILGHLEDKIVSKANLQHWEQSPLKYHYEDLGLKETKIHQSGVESESTYPLPSFPWLDFKKLMYHPIVFIGVQILLLIMLLYLLNKCFQPREYQRAPRHRIDI
ncbi:G protein [Rhizoctonia solani rhabdovirus 1]|nr:G protein [Rhizoctonia solani rhabdovirus 1]